MKRKVKHFRPSVFLKLLSTIILTGILITVLLVGFFQIHFSARVRNQFYKNYYNYYSYIAKEIGSPPDTLLAKNIAREYSLTITYKSDSLNWQSGTSKRNKIIRLVSSMIDDQEYTVRNNDGSRFIFNSDFHGTLRPQPIEFIFLFSMLVGILILSYLLIRNILKPIKDLSAGVVELSAGNFSHEIPVYSTDELASLSESFNQMVRRIKEMISTRDQLLLDVSHELRTPLTRIKLALEMMSDDKNKESISADIKEIEIMITEILESERLKRGHLNIKVNDIAILLKEVECSIIEKGPGINCGNIPKELFLKFDLERIRVVLRNVIENAVKYSHSGSKQILILIEEEKEQVIIKIIDDGIGIPSEDIKNVFEPFYRSDRSRSRKTGGFGLGLAIVKQIVEAHGGSIEIYNNPDRGTTVLITLPRL